jgi:hypothetical protein
MLAATVIGIFLVPALYAAFQVAAERLSVGALHWRGQGGPKPACTGIDTAAEAPAQAPEDGRRQPETEPTFQTPDSRSGLS